MLNKSNISLGLSVITLLFVIVFGIGLVGGNNQPAVGASGSRFPNGLSADTTSPSAGEVRGTTLTFTSTATLGGAVTIATSTVTRSYDGFMVGGGIPPASVATDTPFTLYTHTGNPILCEADHSMLYSNSTTYTPSLQVSVATSTATTPGLNLLASTTLATSTDMFVQGIAARFVMNAGESIIAILGGANTTASSTHFSNYDIEYQTHCWLIGG